MNSVSILSTNTPLTSALQATAVRRRIVASDAVASLVASLAFGEAHRSDHVMLASVTSARIVAATGSPS